MLAAPPSVVLGPDGWRIVVRELGATYEYGPFSECPPSEMTVHPAPAPAPRRASEWRVCLAVLGLAALCGLLTFAVVEFVAAWR
jgi:hypothetical protein